MGCNFLRWGCGGILVVVGELFNVCFVPKADSELVDR